MKFDQIFRRALSLLLCLCMVLSVGVTAFAADGAAVRATDAAFESNKKLTNGGDSDPETYTIDIDALVHGEVKVEKTGVPLDVAIVFDRSDSMSFPANKNDVVSFSSLDSLKSYLSNLKTDKWEGYYRATCIGNGGNVYYTQADTTAEKYVSWEALRYNGGKWQMFETYHTDWIEGPHGVIYSRDSGTEPYYGKWVDIETAYNNYQSRKKENPNTKNSSIQFSIAIPRLTMAQAAIESFITGLNNSAKNLPDGQNHTVSVVSYGGTLMEHGYPTGYKHSVGNNAGKEVIYGAYASPKYANRVSAPSVKLTGVSTDTNGIIGIVRSQYVWKTTATNLAMEAVADGTTYLPKADDNRNRVVILLTDGTPTTGMLFEKEVADPAIAAANKLKSDGVNIFALSFMEGVTPGTGYGSYASSDTEEEKAKDFLQLISSNYPTATDMSTSGKQASNENFMADDGKGQQLMDHFASILGKITTSVASPLPEANDAVSIYDEVTREFMIDADRNLRVYVQEYLGNKQFGKKVYIDNGGHKLTAGADATYNASNKAYRIDWDCNIDKDDPNQPGVNLDISSIRLNWLDAKNGALREMDVENQNAIYPDYKKGYKIGLELPIEVNRDNTLGGNNILTNTSESGLYRSTTDETAKKPSGDKLITYDSPNANVEAKFKTEVYDYFMDLEDLVANQNAGVSSNFAKEIFAAMLEDPAALLDYLKNNLNDYVNLGITLEDLYALIANAGADSFTSTGAQSGATFDFTLDQMLNALVSLTYTSSKTDSIGVAPFKGTTETLNPNYYGPKYVVVDFDETVKTPLDKEGGLNPAVTSKNGKIEGSNICYDFRATYGSGAKSYLEKNYTTVGYQVTAINAPKSQPTNKTVARNFYVIPANVMTYDDTFLKATSGTWENVGTYADSEQSHDNSVTHGYDALYNGTYSKDYYHNALKATTVSKTNGVAQTTFTFNGTGFDIFAQTGPNSGTMAVEVCTDSSFANDYKTFVVDTYLKDTTLNQIPVVRLDGLEYRTWYVRITAFYDSVFDHNYVSQWKNGGLTEEKLRDRYDIPADADFTFIPSASGYDHPATRIANASNGQYNIYIDGIRVYNTLGTNLNAVAAYAYAEADEGVANILNINDALVDSGSTDAWKSNDVSGVLYTAAGSSNAAQGDVTNGIILGMEGALYVKQSGSKFYVYKDAALTQNVQYNGSNVYYRNTTVISPNGREYSGINYYYDGGSASVPMTTKQIREAFGGMPTYYNAKYSQYGPEKEVYLNGSNGVAFKVGTGAKKVMISLKSNNGSAATLNIYDPATKVFVELASTTSRVEMYYDITRYISAEGYIYLKNAGGISAVCNIKTIGTATRSITVDRNLVAWVEDIEKATLPVDGNAQIKHSLNLASDISLNYAVSTATLADYDDSYLEVNFKGETLFLEPEINGEYGYFTVDGITAVDMTEELTATLHLFLGEEEFVSETDVYSVAQYAYAQLNKASASAELKAVCANLLRYGAQAQTFKGNENALADAAMTAEQKAYLTDLNTVSVVSAAKALGDVENGIAWAGKSLVLDSKVAVKAIFTLKDYAGNTEDLNLRVSYVNGKGEEVSLVIEEAELYNAAYGYYAFTVDTLLATDMRSELNMALYDGETQVSETQIYSVESYCASRTGALAELGKTLLAYSDAAKTYFAS